MGASAISCRGLTKRYGQVLALDRLELEVPQGALFGFLGPNGAGMTTLIRLLLGLAALTNGHAEVLGFEIAAEKIRGSPAGGVPASATTVSR